MNIYFDTSGLIKKYLTETGSDNVIKMYGLADTIYTSRISYAEMIAIFERKIRDTKNLEEPIRKKMAEFQNHWPKFYQIEVNNTLNPIIDSILCNHSLRGADTIHLASAMHASEKLKKDLVFASSDEKLLKAASTEHLSVYAC